MIVGPAVIDDVARVAALDAELFGPAAWSEALVEAELTHARLVVARDGTEVVGYAAWSDSTEDAELLRIGVAQERQGRGIGAMLLEAFIAGCEAERLLLEVATTNLAALTLYRRHGFEDLGVRRGYYADGSDALVLARPRSAPGASATMGG